MRTPSMIRNWRRQRRKPYQKWMFDWWKSHFPL